MNRNIIFRILSALLSVYFFSGLAAEIKATDTNVFLILVRLIGGCYFSYFFLFGSKPIVNNSENASVVAMGKTTSVDIVGW